MVVVYIVRPHIEPHEVCPLTHPRTPTEVLDYVQWLWTEVFCDRNPRGK